MKKTLLNSILLIAILMGMSTSVSGMNMTSGDEESDYATLMSDVENALKTLTPKNHHDNNGSQPWLLGNEKLSMDGLVTSIDYIDALKAAKDVVVDLHNQGKTLSEMGEAVEKLRMAMIAVNAKFNPLTEGYYYIVAEYGDDAKNVYGGKVMQCGVDANTPDVVGKSAFIQKDTKQMFYVSFANAQHSKVYLKNVENGKYVGVINDGKWNFTSEKVALNIVSGNDYNWFWGAETTVAARACSFIIMDDENTGISSTSSSCNVVKNITTSSSAWTISWCFRPANDDYNAYLADKEYMDYVNKVKSALKTPTAKQDGDLGTNSWIDGTECTAVIGVETSQPLLDALQAAYDVFVAAHESGKSLEELSAEKAAVDAAMAKVLEKNVPLVDGGIYYMIPRYGDDQGNNNTLVLTSVNDYAWKKPMNKYSTAFMHKVTFKNGNSQKLIIQNVETGKYLGGVEGNKWKYTTEENVYDYTTFVGGDFYSDTKHAHCYGLNIEGNFMTYGNNTAGTEITTTTGGWAWFRAWMFRPVPADIYEKAVNDAEFYALINEVENALGTLTPKNHHDNNGSQPWLLGNEKLSMDGLATSIEYIDALKAAKDVVIDLHDNQGKTLSEMGEAVEKLRMAMAAVNAKYNPLTEGYYYIIAEYGDDVKSTYGGKAIQVANEDAITRGVYDAENFKQLFKVSFANAQHSKVYLQNVDNGKYLGVIVDSKWKFTEEKVALNIVSGNDYNWFHGADKTVAARACSFIIMNDENTGFSSTSSSGSVAKNITTSSSAWTISWCFRPASEEVIKKIINIELSDDNQTCKVSGKVTSDAIASIQQVVTESGAGAIDFTNADLSNLTADDLQFEGNTMAIVSADAAIQGTNIIVKDGDEYTCEELVLTDNADFAPGVEFVATSVTMEKPAADDGWYTMYLPYAFTPGDDMSVYTFKEAQGNSLVFEKVEGEVPAATPLLCKRGEGATVMSFGAENVAITTKSLDGASFNGTFVEIPAGEATGNYILNATGTAFGKATSLAYVPAFHCYYAVDNSSSVDIKDQPTDDDARASQLTIVIFDNTTGVKTTLKGAEAAKVFGVLGVAGENNGVNIKEGKKYVK